MSDFQRTYRVYAFDGVRRSLWSELITASSDEEAIAADERPGSDSQLEVWEGRRLVAQLGRGAANA